MLSYIKISREDETLVVLNLFQMNKIDELAIGRLQQTH